MILMIDLMCMWKWMRIYLLNHYLWVLGMIEIQKLLWMLKKLRELQKVKSQIFQEQ